MTTESQAADPSATPGKRRPARARNLALAAVVGAAFVGYFVGLGGGTPRDDGTRMLRPDAPAKSARTASPAVSYADLAERPGQVNRTSTKPWDERVGELRVAAPAEPILDEGAKRQSLAKRGAGRAYNGAPPVIPHAVKGLSDASCSICHGRDLSPGSGLARRPPHDHYTQCTQCHATPAAPALVGEPVGVTGARLARTSFVGLPAPAAGARAWKGAPPVVPHSTWMRGDCKACHGPSGWPGLHTSHPERINCLQCHAAGAVLEQAPTTGSPPAFLPGPKIGSR